MIQLLVMKILPLMAAVFFAASSMDLFDGILIKVEAVRDEYNAKIFNDQIRLRVAYKGKFPPDATGEDIIRMLKEEDLLEDRSLEPGPTMVFVPGKGNESPYFYVDYAKIDESIKDKSLADLVEGLKTDATKVQELHEKQRESIKELQTAVQGLQGESQGEGSAGACSFCGAPHTAAENVCSVCSLNFQEEREKAAKMDDLMDLLRGEP